jgi:hypothetical protein
LPLCHGAARFYLTRLTTGSQLGIAHIYQDHFEGPYLFHESDGALIA